MVEYLRIVGTDFKRGGGSFRLEAPLSLLGWEACRGGDKERCVGSRGCDLRMRCACIDNVHVIQFQTTHTLAEEVA